jgi:hypothetical protein
VPLQALMIEVIFYNKSENGTCQCEFRILSERSNPMPHEDCSEGSEESPSFFAPSKEVSL